MADNNKQINAIYKESVSFKDKKDEESNHNKTFMMKLRAEFRTPKTHQSATFRFVPVMKGLNEALFALKKNVKIVSEEDHTEMFDTNANFPTGGLFEEYYKTEKTIKQQAQQLVTVVFTIISDVHIGKLKTSGLTLNLQKHGFWIV